MTKINTDLKILFLDIETSLPKAYVPYSLFNVTIPANYIIEHPRMIAFTAKWYGRKKVYAFSEYHHSRKEMLEQIHALLDEADVVIGYNSDSFDLTWIQGELAVEGILPPSPYKKIDILKVVKKNFRFISRKLDYVSERLIGDNKVDYNMAKMWLIVDNPNTDEKTRKREWDAMMRYARKDTQLLEPLFEKLLPWIRIPHPVRALDETTCCIACGSEGLQTRGKALTLSGSYVRLWCPSCGKWQRGKNREDVGQTREIS